MKKPLTFMSAALISATLLTGCGANNAAQDNNTPMKNVTYKTNQVNPNAASNVNNYNGYNNVNYRNMTFPQKTAQKIAKRVNQIKGVKYASTLISGNTVYVGITTTANADANTNQKVVNVVQQYVGNKNVQVVTDQNTVNRMTTLNNRIMNNAPAREINSDVRGILNDLGDAVTRPFQNNAR
ncbi:YhcN/YlaJ family sporulation lipoprotein [Pullulanibacillus sp. KACC 23026]|uniref:YhcN/YlaJ family sporulation lipoprotein n=1 Tax=Pullulanibacillus sp. KACC 23026 TaxID=3028315 RepID=UPI0023B1CA62|nr:YhcN/YlaJ family sporulation lipoprotein [Pullulanibacillus sp. KACC 23026]WEG14066.1 YhcN/YlaJ family sporulation lipoprotein [Pullulanibacillus sp. KACC 23026]